ncbi:MAG: SPOR domain-containing protein [Muribaculaceae bacterium]|jgi:hypothetical protein|nr:SPOR domain-containing protein [Muribaculaceae bacterium]
MKQIFLAAIAVALLATGCKTNEANYRAAYEVAKNKQTQAEDGIGGAPVQRFEQPKPHTVDGVTLMMRSEPIAYPKDGGATRDNVKTYNVVVGQFRQIFNARQMRQRLMDNGYPDAMIVQNREPVYYVIALSCATPAEAAQAIERVKGDARIALRSPLPYILKK